MTDVDAMDKCFSKIPQTDSVDDGLIAPVRACAFAHIWDFSIRGGVLNDNDTHPFTATG